MFQSVSFIPANTLLAGLLTGYGRCVRRRQCPRAGPHRNTAARGTLRYTTGGS